MSLGKKYLAIAPLSGFSWKGESIEFNKFNFKIVRYSDLPDLQGLESDLSRSERDIIRSAAHWLSFEYEETDIFNQSNIVILFLIGLWLSVPTKTHVRLIFKFSAKTQAGKERGLIRCLDHFQWITGQASKSIKTEQIEEAFVNIQLLEPIILKKKRLWNALVLTVAGCMTTRWQVAFMNFSSAVEAILTYKKGGGIMSFWDDVKEIFKNFKLVEIKNEAHLHGDINIPFKGDTIHHSIRPEDRIKIASTEITPEMEKEYERKFLEFMKIKEAQLASLPEKEWNTQVAGTSVSTAVEVLTTKPLHLYQTIGAPGIGNGEFQFGGGVDSNSGIFVDDEYLYITDWNNNRLQRFKLDVDNYWVYFDSLTDIGNLYSAIYVDKNGIIFLQGMGILKKYDIQKNFIEEINIDISNFCRFSVDNEGNIFAQAGSDRNVIKKYDSKGSMILSFGGFGSSDGRFNNSGWSADIIADSIGNIYMLDTGGNRVQKFDNQGNFLRKWQVEISGYSYMAIDENDKIYVVEDGYIMLNKHNTECVLIQKYRIPQGVVSGGCSYIFVKGNRFFASNHINHNIKVFSLN